MTRGGSARAPVAPCARDIERDSDEESILSADARRKSFDVQQQQSRSLRKAAAFLVAGIVVGAVAVVMLGAGSGSHVAKSRSASRVHGRLQKAEKNNDHRGRDETGVPEGGMLGLSESRSGTVGKNNCNATKKCATAGMQCYEQNERYAQCRADCIPGPDPTHWDGQAWSCKTLGERTPGEDPCGVTGQDCRTSKCCKLPGHTCFEKNASWATCKAECIPGAPDFGDVDGYPWNCKELGERTASTAEWVQGQCASGWDNCVSKGCCQGANEVCYKQNDYYGACKVACSDPGWKCEEAGYRTPGPPAKGARMPEWAFDKCSAPETGCLDSRCCIGMDVQCYEKTAGWAQCKESCTPGPHADDNNETWSCKAIGPRSYGVSRTGFPSLYCFSVIRTVGYEVGLMQAQWDHKAGIFACDAYSLLSADGTVKIGDAQSIQFPGAPITVSIDHTAGNTELFVHAWDAIIAAGIWKNHTFTMKVDPDAVLLPDRVRWHLAPQVGNKIYIVNCPIGDMMYGALEVFSYYGIKEWAARGHGCAAPNNWGEDKYMTNCMDSLGVARVHDEGIIADNLCLGSNCGNGAAAAFHPYKDVGAWMQCWNTATKPAVSV